MQSLDPNLIAEHNRLGVAQMQADYDFLGAKLRRRGVDIDGVLAQAGRLSIALPSWGVGTGGTRFARFPGRGEPRNVFEKLQDCAVIQQLARCTPTVSLHIPWDRCNDWSELRGAADQLGLGFDAMNSNTFSDQPGQRLSYKYGSLTHVDRVVRQQAIEHNVECIQIGRTLGSKALTVWIGDGSNFPGQQDFRGTFQRYLESMKAIYAAVPSDWRLFLEHKLYEPAMYSTVIQDWGTSYLAASTLGERALCLVDLGHHAPTVNIEMIVARLIGAGKLGGFHFNDSKYGDDDLDAGSVAPYRLFLVFNELIAAERDGAMPVQPAYMLDQSHNVTDPIESLVVSAGQVQRAYVQALLVDREALAEAQRANDALMATRTVRQAFEADVTPILQRARHDAGGAIEPLDVFRLSRYRERVAEERPPTTQGGSGIV